MEKYEEEEGMRKKIVREMYYIQRDIRVSEALEVRYALLLRATVDAK